MKIIYPLLVAALCAHLLTVGCTEGPLSPPPDDVLDTIDPLAFEPYFPNSSLITNMTPLSKTRTDRPTFGWKRTNESVVVLAVFDTTIDLDWDHRRIVNIDRIVWLWHSQLGKESEGGVNIEKMIPMKGGQIDTARRSFQLDRKTYYWLVWAFDPDARRIKWSSPRMKLVVDR